MLRSLIVFTHLLFAYFPPPPVSSKYYKRGRTETMMFKPDWVNRVRLGHSAAQQVGGDLGLVGKREQ